ncbi:MAG: ParA family protein [Desulfobacteraceae bacterium]|nr:ParA family protein [Desulfobacteraceae bacterium]
MAKIIAITNQKGGVGKTTITFNLAKGLASRGYNVLAIDNDPQGNLTTSILEKPEDLEADILNIFKEQFDFKPQKITNNLDLIGATIKLAEVADNVNMYLPLLIKTYLTGDDNSENIADNYDYIIIDCLPSFGPLNVAALIAADFVLVPTKPAPFAIQGLVSLFKNIVMLKKHNFNRSLKIAGIVMNLVEKTNIHKDLEKELKSQYNDMVFEFSISKGTKLEESPYYGESVMEYAPDTKQTKQFNGFIREFLRRVE